jgi:hypothetical protein
VAAKIKFPASAGKRTPAVQVVAITLLIGTVHLGMLYFLNYWMEFERI